MERTAENIAKEIWEDLRDRAGFGFHVDPKIEEEILADWAKIIKGE